MQTLLVFFCLLFVACGSGAQRSSDTREANDVRWYGAIRTIFDGNWDASTTLADGLPPSHAYGLGAISELRGEFVVKDDQVFLGYPAEGPLPRVVQSAAPSSEAAALLVTAEVPRWKEVPLPADVAASEVDATIRDIAESHGVDVTQPFPFLLRGTFRSLDWHVADGTRVEPGMRPDANAQRGTISEGDGTIVGFYSTQHQGVFTMMGQNTHMHVILADNSVLGHVGAVELLAGTVLSLPRTR